MTESDVDNDRALPTASYRCVCGESLEMATPTAQCGACGRRYDEAFLNGAGADTVSLDPGQLSARLIGRPEEDPLIGQRLGHFKMLSRIGDGGMGAVYHALDESLQRYVALKVIHRTAGEPADIESPNGTEANGSDRQDIERLFQEARAQARVNHPHVVHVYFVGNDENTPFLAMELVSEGTLADRLESGPIPFAEIVSFAIQVTTALDCAAEYDIVHGDIKPSNVLVANSKTVKLSDFGLARRLSAPSQSSSKLSGTPDYMPPEATRGGVVDHRGDMYSLGVTLFQCTFGRLPYSTPEQCDLSDRLRVHRNADVEFPERWPAELPEGWRDVLAKLLNKDPSARFGSFAELESALRQLTPANVPVANPLLRGLAWGIDTALLATGLVVIQVIVTFLRVNLASDGGDGSSGIPEFGLLGSLAAATMATGLLLGTALLQAHWGNTTGKRFLQILIVDQHGLKPGRRVLAARTAFQFSWAWWIAISGPLFVLGLPGVAYILGWTVLAMMLIDCAFIVLFNGRSLHDSIFATRVVLDVALDKPRSARQ